MSRTAVQILPILLPSYAFSTLLEAITRPRKNAGLASVTIIRFMVLAL